MLLAAVDKMYSVEATDNIVIAAYVCDKHEFIKRCEM